MEIPKEIVDKATEILSKIVSDRYPDDDWFSLSDDWDLNVFIDSDKCKRATIFPVIEGRTNIQEGFRVL